MTDQTQTPTLHQTDLNAIVSELDCPLGKLPVEAIKAIRQNRDEMVPRLIGMIEQAVREVEEGGGAPETNGHFFALFLLGEFRATEGLPTIIKAISLPGEGPFDLFGDAITESLASVLAALAEDRLDLLLSVIGNKQINEYVRWAVADSLARMVAGEVHPRNEIVELLRQALRAGIDYEDMEIVTGLISTLTDLYPEEAYEEIKEAYARRLVEYSCIQLENVDRQIERGQAETLKDLKNKPAFLDDTIQELQRWTSFQKDEPKRKSFSPPIVPQAQSRSDRAKQPSRAPKLVPAPIDEKASRVGRNQPCPCGSGKKFKKCCGSTVNRGN